MTTPRSIGSLVTSLGRRGTLPSPAKTDLENSQDGFRELESEAEALRQGEHVDNPGVILTDHRFPIQVDARKAHGRRRRDSLYARDMRPLLWLLLPFGILLVIVDAAPLVLGVVSSFKELNLHTLQFYFQAPWSPGRNYGQAASGGGGLPISGLVATWQTVEYSILATVIALPLALMAALTVSERRSRATTVARIIYMLPAALPLFSTGFVWRMLLSPGFGLLDQFRKFAGLGTHPNTLLIGGHSFATLVGVDVWFAWAFIYLFALAGLQSIRRELYEAATIDGASGWQKFRYVVWPSLQRVLLVATVLSTINHYNDFTLPFVLFGNSPPSGAIIVPVETYLAGFSLFNFGLADALALIGFVGIVVPLLAYVALVGGTKVQEPAK